MIPLDYPPSGARKYSVHNCTRHLDLPVSVMRTINDSARKAHHP